MPDLQLMGEFRTTLYPHFRTTSRSAPHPQADFPCQYARHAMMLRAKSIAAILPPSSCLPWQCASGLSRSRS